MKTATTYGLVVASMAACAAAGIRALERGSTAMVMIATIGIMCSLSFIIIQLRNAADRKAIAK